MTSLVVCMSSGKGTWSNIYSLIKFQDWENIFIITQTFFKDKIKLEKPHNLIVIDETETIQSIIAQLTENFKDKLVGDVAVNMISGTGKEHTALLISLFKIGVGIRFIEATEQGINEIW
ncbi:hypothetical protein HYV79_02740 [Candidatus Woesearchaeota archaeon]|nr:hypothetical protein [Candidatus Woesearchaeota archaeon]